MQRPDFPDGSASRRMAVRVSVRKLAGGLATALLAFAAHAQTPPDPVFASGFQAPALPAWRQGMAVGQWKQIPNTALSSAPMAVHTYPALGNGPAAKIDAWGGFALDTRDAALYSPANGGHSDYAGNEVNRIRLLDDAPAWTEPRASTPVAQITAGGSHYADGRPVSRHVCYGAALNQFRNRILVLGGSRWQDGSMLNTMDGFDLAGSDWDAANTFASGPALMGNIQCPTVTEDKSTGDLYMFLNWDTLRWSNATNAWTTRLANTSLYGQYAASALDTQRRRILLLGGNGNDRGYYDIASNTVQTVTLSGPNAASVMGDYNGLVYDPQLDAYLLRKIAEGGTVYRINAQSFSVDVLPTTGGAGVPVAINAVVRRFLYVPQLTGVVYAPTYDGNLWFLRTH